METMPEAVQGNPATRFLAWLGEEAKGFWTITGYVVFTALIVASIDYTVQSAMINWGFVKAPPLPEVGDTPFQYFNVFSFLSVFIWGPIKEEVMFRLLPLAFIIAFVSRRPGLVFGAVIILTAIFGAIHPYSTVGRIQVAIDGFFFGLVFLKCGGLNNRFVKAWVCAVCAHGLSNVFVVVDAWWDYFQAIT